jgi:hypothetical protein
VRTVVLIVLFAGATVGSLALHGCSNSILRNAAEAGVETVLEGPLPTPTPPGGSGR